MPDQKSWFQKWCAPDPQMVADAVLKLLQAKPGTSDFRTTVDSMGMAAGVDAINAATETTMQGIAKNMGVDLTLKTRASPAV